VEHRHRCVYCRTLWFCHEDCPLAGASACEECREKIRLSPQTPRRVIPLASGDRVLDRLTEQIAERLRQRLRQRPPLL
jgi:hypothetical protein